MAKGSKNDGEGRKRGGFKSSRHGKASAAGPKAQQKLAAEEREKRGVQHTAHEASRFLRGQRIDPRPIDGKETVAELIEGTYLAYNAARLREACQLFAEKMLEPDVTIGLSITGALTPAGLGMSALIPLIEGGFVDWIISTGANLYHDTHFGLGLAMHRGNAQESDVVLREEGVVRIYDIFFDYDVLLSTDAFFRKIIGGREFQRAMSSAEFHNLAGKYVREREKALGIDEKGHDYFLQITDARPDTGGLSGATPAEAVSWGKIDPDRLPDAVVCYLDSTVALPLLTSYAFARHEPRPLKRLFDRREQMMARLRSEYEKSTAEPADIDHTDSKLPQHR
ncbi:MAG: deoxyhypusine synthase family protein [Gemmatimonadaceae bacterium]